MPSSNVKSLAEHRQSDVRMTEAELRIQLAAAYRIFAHLGWDYLIYGHISVSVPGPEQHFLINPFGLRFDEVTASNLVKIDLQGRKVEHSEYDVNPAGFIIHSAVHEAREDAKCVMHTHTIPGMTMAATKAPLRALDFAGAALTHRVAYHDFSGVHSDDSDRESLVADLGTKNFMILRNHGLLVCGKTIPSAFKRLYDFETACKVQVGALAMNAELVEPSENIALAHAAVLENDDQGEMAFKALTRLMEKKDSSFLN
ncbi:class II aldolase/adducin family protein [Methylobacterium sp. NEAU 140]|uniref:class II aldolase/adducin family protein n=1 Tax=Methylobacterium sp. NEAU 140 TaxID=3064945 RepID=UPI002735B7D4|nr:class II aldolase/adducin family protein [Methylobacterium sp. NEAU 140]MDP4026589.1 class II aldolase/adducin family protein [Methylobacterium sp. NEAU 140]